MGRKGPVSHCEICNRPHLQAVRQCVQCGNKFNERPKRAEPLAEKALLLGSAAALALVK